MKKIIYISILAVTMLLAGCDRAMDPSPEGTEQLLLSASSKSLTKSKADPETDPAPETEPQLLPDGLDVGIYVHDRAAEEGVLPLANNKKHLAKEGLLAAEDHIPVFLIAGKNYSVLGYSPYREFGGGGHTTIPFVHGDEVIISLEGSINDVSSERNSVSLIFEHKTVQIQFKVGVKLPDGTYREGVKAGTFIEITGFDRNATLDLATGKLLPIVEEKDTISAYTDLDVLADYFLATPPTSFFLPENGLKKLDVEIRYNGKMLKLDPPISRDDWKIGSSYVYTISINEQYEIVAIEMASSLIQWKKGDDDEGLKFPY